MRNKELNTYTPPRITLDMEEYQELLDSRRQVEDKIQELTQEYSELMDKNVSAESTIKRLQWEILQLRRRLWGKSSEKRQLPESPDQLRLCFESPVGEDPEDVKEEARRKAKKSESEYNRFRKSFKKPVTPHARKPIPPHFERRDTLIEPDVDLSGAIRISEEITEQYAIQPFQVYVERTIRPRYKMPDGSFVIAPLPDMAHPRSNASESVLAHLAVAKYTDHLPHHRQIDIFARGGVKLAPSTVSNWMKAAAQRIEPIYNELREKVKASRYVMADETPHKVLESDKSGALHSGYMWVFYLPHCKSPFFEYHRGRNYDNIGTLLNCSVRAVQSDGYGAYDIFDRLEGYLHLCCWAHVRRKFIEAESYDPPRAGYILGQISKLYEVERIIKEKKIEGEEVVRLRRDRSYPVIRTMERWVKENYTLLPEKSPIRKAVEYLFVRFEQLSHYVNDAGFEIDNNPVERTIRPLTLNRKNVLFSGSHEAADEAAIFFSLLGCCKENDVNPFVWLCDALKKVSGCSDNDYSSLLPFNWKMQNKEEKGG